MVESFILIVDWTDSNALLIHFQVTLGQCIIVELQFYSKGISVPHLNRPFEVLFIHYGVHKHINIYILLPKCDT